MLSKNEKSFIETVWAYYAESGRELPWRMPEKNGNFDPYKIMVSEIMLQQTQVPRVIQKYQEFLQKFPSVEMLAAAPLAEVLRVWQGLGYNRRAKYLHEAAQEIVREYRGVFPKTKDELVKLPGIGTNTAAAILAYAYNQPVVFVETNIRTVFIYHFFQGKTDVTDKEIVHFVARTLPGVSTKTTGLPQVRLWFWALMDYGTYLKKTQGNINTSSKHYTKQSRFEGSKRQLRGAVLRQLAKNSQSLIELQGLLQDERLHEVLTGLVSERMIHKHKGRYELGRPT